MVLYTIGRRLLYPVAKLCFRLRYCGLENIPAHGKLVLCCNHRSVCDPAILAFRFPRKIRYMAKSELFDDHGRFIAFLLRKLGSFPVRRGKGDAESVKTSISILEGGGVLGIFPQGGVVFDNAPFRPKAGAAMIAAHAKAPVLPACIYCDGRLKFFGSPVTVRFGTPIPFEVLFPNGDNGREGLRGASQLIADQINSLLEMDGRRNED